MCGARAYDFRMGDGDTRGKIADALNALRARDAGVAASLLRSLVDRMPADQFPWTALANAEIMLGDLPAAAAVLDRCLSHSPRDIAALLQRGWLHERAGDVRAAVSFYQAARNQAAASGGADPPLAPLLDHAARFCDQASAEFAASLAKATAGPLSDVMSEAVGLLRGEREIDLQQPSVFYYPGLAQRRFFDPDDFPWLAPMLALLPDMQAELAAIAAEGADGFSPYVQTQPGRPSPNNPLLDNPAWTALHFWQGGAVVEDNARRCPATMAALSHAPMPVIPGRSPNAHWSRLRPGAHIAPHTGMLNTRLICHIPIETAPACTLRVGSEARGWEDGVPLIFDDSMEHEARNAGDRTRTVLLFEIWRPEIPETDRAVIARIFQAIGQHGL